MTDLVILDNTVLANIALARRTDLVLGLWPGGAYTTPEVLAEHQQGIASGVVPADAWQDLTVIELTAAEAAFAAALPRKLHAGERTCLAAALHRRAALASDDLDARQEAERHGVSVTGTVGILLRCVQRGLLTRAGGNMLLDRMIRAGYHAPVASLDTLLGAEP